MVTPTITGFEVLEHLPDNGTSFAWKARQTSLSRFVLIRMLDLQASATKQEGFTRIALALSKLKCAAIPQVINIMSAEGDVSVLIQEYAPGTVLADLLVNGARIGSAETAQCGLEIAKALSEAWERMKLVHRNLAPEGIEIAPDGTARLMCFDSATFAIPGEDRLQYDEGFAAGSPWYMAPEQVAGSPAVDFRADIYGLGALLYHLVTGVRPFGQVTDPEEAMQCQESATLPSPRTFAPKLSVGLEAIIVRCMKKSPAARYGAWKEVIEDLGLVAQGKAPRHKMHAGVANAPGTVAMSIQPRSLSKDMRKRQLNAAVPQAMEAPILHGGVALALWLLLFVGVAALGVYRWQKTYVEVAGVDEIKIMDEGIITEGNGDGLLEASEPKVEDETDDDQGEGEG